MPLAEATGTAIESRGDLGAALVGAAALARHGTADGGGPLATRMARWPGMRPARFWWLVRGLPFPLKVASPARAAYLNLVLPVTGGRHPPVPAQVPGRVPCRQQASVIGKIFPEKLKRS